MVNLSKLSNSARKAAMEGGTALWGMHGSAELHLRYAEAMSSRRRCYCGCKGRITHNGMTNGVTLMSGCELHVRRWVRDPLSAIRALSDSSPILFQNKETTSVGRGNR